MSTKLLHHQRPKRQIKKSITFLSTLKIDSAVNKSNIPRSPRGAGGRLRSYPYHSLTFNGFEKFPKETYFERAYLQNKTKKKIPNRKKKVIV